MGRPLRGGLLRGGLDLSQIAQGFSSFSDLGSKALEISGARAMAGRAWENLKIVIY